MMHEIPGGRIKVGRFPFGVTKVQKVPLIAFDVFQQRTDDGPVLLDQQPQSVDVFQVHRRLDVQVKLAVQLHAPVSLRRKRKNKTKTTGSFQSKTFE